MVQGPLGQPEWPRSGSGGPLSDFSLRGPSLRPWISDSFIGSHRYVLEYLTEEVVYRQSESVQQFLLETSILDHLNGPLCDAVAHRENSARILGHLQHNNLFVIPLDNERYWYRYHHLFADLLGNLLRRERSPDRIRELLLVEVLKQHAGVFPGSDPWQTSSSGSPSTTSGPRPRTCWPVRSATSTTSWTRRWTS